MEADKQNGPAKSLSHEGGAGAAGDEPNGRRNPWGVEAGPESSYKPIHDLRIGHPPSEQDDQMRANLKAEADQKAIFQEIRNFLAGR